MAMIQRPISFDLPAPWSGKHFQVQQLGSVNYLVGPNGSGKSRFVDVLKTQLPNCRLLGTDRLRGMEKDAGLGVWGDYFLPGIQKGHFQAIKTTSANLGYAMDTLIILEERMDLRLRVEATLSHLFDRHMFLEWDSGNLLPKAILGSTAVSYRLDRDECHGIRELLVLLTHLYNEDYEFLIIDEPELNLHPQYQAYFMEEVRKVAGLPGQGDGKKIVFLITHSPFTLDFRSIEDVKSVISFDLKYSIPKQMLDLDTGASARLSTLLPRLNVHHKQLFFSDNPVFVEGILDAQILEAMQECRTLSITGAGSCVIDAGGSDEVNKYVELCRAFGKVAYFLYDLDSLFVGNLRACVKADGTLTSFLAALGLGPDFTQYCGFLDRKLTEAILKIRTSSISELNPLKSYFDRLSGGATLTNESLARARVATIVQIHRNRDSVIRATSSQLVEDILGRLAQIVGALRGKNILLLSAGELEHYLPSYSGNLFELSENSKRSAVAMEIAHLGQHLTDEQLLTRYGGLFEAIRSLPAKPSVDIDKVLREYLSNYIHELQRIVVKEARWQLLEIRTFLARTVKGIDRVLSLEEFVRTGTNQFSAKIRVIPLHGAPARIVKISDQTNAGMMLFTLEKE